MRASLLRLKRPKDDPVVEHVPKTEGSRTGGWRLRHPARYQPVNWTPIRNVSAAAQGDAQNNVQAAAGGPASMQNPAEGNTESSAQADVQASAPAQNFAAGMLGKAKLQML